MSKATRQEPNEIPRLPMWGRYRVPWFVTAWKDGKPEFRLLERERWIQAVREGRCWVCGGELRRNRFAFVIGPMCTVNRISADPPMHRACAFYAVEHCPFLTDPNRVRRQDELTEEAKKASGDWGMIERNPGVSAIWVCKRFDLERGAGKSTLLCRLHRPTQVWWFREGRLATREEVEAAFEAGCPALEEIAKKDGPGALEALRAAQADARRYMPR